jgi:uncharacterized membrane protein YbhN (UPF0104 family)
LNKWKSRLRSLAVVAILAVVFFFLGRSLLRNWRQIPFEQLEFNCRYLVLSAACVSAYFLCCALGWQRSLSVYGCKLKLVHSLEIIATSQLGKYVPGKVWFALSRMYLARLLGVPERVSLVSMILETVFLLMTGGMIAVLAAGTPWIESLPARVLLAILVVLVGFVVIHPRVFGRGVCFLMRRLKKESVEMKLTYGGMLTLLVVYCMCWLFSGLGFFLLVRSFFDLRAGDWFLFVGVFAAAWIVGFLSVVTPSGLGIREAVMTFLLSFSMPLSMAIVVSLVARVWATLAELIFFVASVPGIRSWRYVGTERNRL